jgi:hypothetical protein
VRDAEERVMRVADFDESFPKFSTFSDGAKCDGIADNCHQTLSSGDGSVQQFCVRQKPEIEIGVFLVLRRRSRGRRRRRQRAACFPSSDSREENGAKLFALNVENAFN